MVYIHFQELILCIFSQLQVQRCHIHSLKSTTAGVFAPLKSNSKCCSNQEPHPTPVLLKFTNSPLDLIQWCMKYDFHSCKTKPYWLWRYTKVAKNYKIKCGDYTGLGSARMRAYKYNSKNPNLKTHGTLASLGSSVQLTRTSFFAFTTACLANHEPLPFPVYWTRGDIYIIQGQPIRFSVLELKLEFTNFLFKMAKWAQVFFSPPSWDSSKV